MAEKNGLHRKRCSPFYFTEKLNARRAAVGRRRGSIAVLAASALHRLLMLFLPSVKFRFLRFRQQCGNLCVGCFTNRIYLFPT